MKRKIINFISLCVFSCAVLFFVGCGGGSNGGNNQDPNRGFDVQVLANNIPTIARVEGSFVSGSGTFGTRNSFQILETSGVGATQIVDAKVPGTWQLTYGPSFSGGSLCLTFTTENRNVSLGSFERLNCVPRFFSFTASPDSVDALNPPSTVIFNGKGINSLYGNPVLAYYNELGNIVASTSSGQLLYDNGNVEGISVNLPDISQVYNGTYTVAVHNVNFDGTWEIIGAATMNVYGNPPPPPTGGGNGGDECGPPPPPDQPQLPCNQS